ncbi:hypothetical protein P691DRAFT_782627 [Macrolepiota fuliginosa MF-IS2]|uniref:Uncharacterized protein n=1 Tax=Macrolepiota fuliginosa MF-IS2 TaxID=1400762 RepID=A0A9P6C3F5_9AGAR|nr:hypothetical protein P691DRAFT_782627 [Macrolepiota fuliginosa MF-IS2]
MIQHIRRVGHSSPPSAASPILPPLSLTLPAVTPFSPRELYNENPHPRYHRSPHISLPQVVHNSSADAIYSHTHPWNTAVHIVIHFGPSSGFRPVFNILTPGAPPIPICRPNAIITIRGRQYLLLVCTPVFPRLSMLESSQAADSGDLLASAKTPKPKTPVELVARRGEIRWIPPDA